MNNNFIKVSAYNRYDQSTIVPTYINTNYITSLNIITDNEDTIYLVYIIDGSYRVTKESYEYITNLLYGKESENA